MFMSSKLVKKTVSSTSTTECLMLYVVLLAENST